ncbi:MAG: ribose transporter permease [Frondihabitans sp.]|nr:ribose transporter permease [Frondihabitans sp.]
MTTTHTSNTANTGEVLSSSPAPFSRKTTVGSVVGRYGLVIAWALVIVLFGAILPGTFLTGANAANILGSQAVIVVLTLGVLFPMTSGDFDMSAASVLTLSAMIVAQLNVNAHWPILAAVAAALAAGTALGFVNGFITTRLAIDPFIVTLGTGTFANGLTLWISGSNTVSGIDAGLVNAVVGGHLFGVPLEFFYALALCAVIWWVFEYTRIGRLFTIIGQGREVARLSGAPVRRVRTIALSASGLIAAFAGVLYAGNSGAADPTSGTVLLLPAFAGAFLGATVIKPGRYNPWGSIIAVYFLVTGITGLQMLGASSFVQDLFYGAALVAAVALSRIMRKRSSDGDSK